MELLYQPYLQVRSNMGIVYTKYLGSRRASLFDRQKELQQHQVHNFQLNKAYSGSLSAGAVKRIRRAVELLVESTPRRIVFNPIVQHNVHHKLSFITLTIPTATDLKLRDVTKKVLEPMIRHLRQVHGMKSYVWKAELQQRGQIHYHLTSDVFIHYQHLRNKWNQLLARAGYMSEYVAKEGHNNANSTDIHSVKNIRDLASYLVKYFTKQEQNPVAMDGKIWDCSKNLKEASYFETELTQDVEIDILHQQQQQQLKVVPKESFTLIKTNGFKFIRILPIESRRAYQQHLRDIYNGITRSKECTKINTPVLNLVHQKQDTSTIIPARTQLELKL